MSKLTDIGYIRTLLGEADTGLKKKFGQNFLINPSIPVRISEEGIPGSDYGVLEIGPGIGTLTAELAQRARKVVSVEIDRTLIPILGQTLVEYNNVEIINEDIQKVDIPALVTEKFADCTGVCVCANLPYYITTPILMNLLESGAPFDRITIMVQSEVAQRLTAAPGSEEYGAITAVLSYYGKTKRVLSVPAGNFLPAPKVDSAVISVQLHKERPAVLNERTLFRVIKGAFGQRRKTLLNSLSTEFPHLNKESVKNAIVLSGIAPEIRGERLGIEQFITIADNIYNLKNMQK